MQKEATIKPDGSTTGEPPKNKLLPIAILVLVLLGFAITGLIFAPALIKSLSRQDTSAASPAQPPATAPVAAPEKSIAVLPFVNMSEEKANEYFSDGISEELLNLLAKVPQLKVAARTSSFSFKGKKAEIPQIAQALHVANVLEGSVRKSGDQIRITAQLIRADQGYHLWSDTYDRKLDDIFKIQDEIAGEVVKQLKITLLGAAPTARPTNPQAYTLFLQARQLSRQSTAAAFQQSDALYQQVLALDPHYAPAWDGQAANLINETGMGLRPSKRALRKPKKQRKRPWRPTQTTHRRTAGSAGSRPPITITPWRRGITKKRFSSMPAT